ncbi:MAG: DUF3160 domain-containing protein [Bacteroidales bacterium]|nr:DUF3160 domain-containing protein [Bacteroidales bacterium]
MNLLIMTWKKYKAFAFIISFVSILLFAFSTLTKSKQKNDNSFENISADTIGVLKGVFDIPELTISPSPITYQSFSFDKSEKIIDYDVSPAGINVAALAENFSSKNSIKFWQIGENKIADSCLLPEGLKPLAIAWHPNAKSLFVMGYVNSKYQIYRLDRNNKSWVISSIFSTTNQLRRLVVCPRPFIIKSDYKNRKDYYSYRIFFGMDNGDKSYRIVSVTETGKRFYQVIGPSKTFSKFVDEDVEPSNIKADWALPVAFHPAGHQMIWQDKSDNFFVAEYDSKYWGNSNPMNIGIKNGTITPTPNGLGLIHWQKGKSGIGIYLLSTKTEEIQIPEYSFISTPSSVPDGKGIIGLTKANEQYSLNYVPIVIPLADVLNAWMFAYTKNEIDLFKNQYGLFRPNSDDQIYKLYETENYYCTSYSRNVPTRPYLVTTDIFWELFGAAYQGLFIVKEREDAIPNFWKFITEADSCFKKSNKNSVWIPVFTTLKDLYTDNLRNSEVIRIQNEKDSYSEVSDTLYEFSDLKPRGHYTSNAEMAKYFKAFRYFTSIFKTKQKAIQELNLLPSEIKSYAEKWIESYSGFISPSRSPLVWDNRKNHIPNYCRYPQKQFTIFPLSWGFDNEVLYSTVYHDNVPSALQVTGADGERLLPSGLDLAAALGNGFAEKLLDSDYKKYPPLRKVIENLKDNFKKNSNESYTKDNIYNKWINAISVQWIDTLNSTNGSTDKEIWQTKRLQTGLATWATLRHATILVNERTAAECGEGGFEEILMRAPRGYVEPDPNTFSAIADLFETAIKYVPKSMAGKTDMEESADSEKRSLYVGITERLRDAAKEARAFQLMAEKEIKGEALTKEENENILYVAGIGEHLFLVFNSLSNKDYALSNPDPIAKITDVAGGGIFPYLMAAVGNTMEWDYVVPFFGRHQIVKGSIYSYYEFSSTQLLNDKEWQKKANSQEMLPWIKQFATNQTATGVAKTCYSY